MTEPSEVTFSFGDRLNHLVSNRPALVWIWFLLQLRPVLGGIASLIRVLGGDPDAASLVMVGLLAFVVGVNVLAVAAVRRSRAKANRN